MRIVFVAVATALINAGAAILSGEPLMWNNYAYVVKVLAHGEAVKNCVGTLITSSLVITAPECVKNETTHKLLLEFIVITTGQQTQDSLVPSQFYVAQLIEAKPRWALLKIQPLDVDKICPPPPAARRVARLPLNPTLANPSQVRIDVGSLSETNCYLLAFGTVENSADYALKATPLRLSLERLNDENAKEKVGLYTARIVNNSTACFDDMGGALICHVTKHEEDYVVGMFRFLNFYDGLEVDRSSLSYCTHAIEMVFDAFVNEPDLLRDIERYDYGGFFDVYEKCMYTDL